MSWALCFLITMAAGSTGAAFAREKSHKTATALILMAYIAAGTGFWKLWLLIHG